MNIRTSVIFWQLEPEVYCLHYHALDLKPSLQYDSLLTPPYTTSSLMRDAGD